MDKLVNAYSTVTLLTCKSVINIEFFLNTYGKYTKKLAL